MIKKKNPNHRELEVKIEAGAVTVAEFHDWIWSHDIKPDQYLHVIGWDTYYAQGVNVLRHRQSSGAGELTVKRRTSRTSTKDRVEIDLHFDHKTTTEDVKAFLLATGWEPEFSVEKDAHIFWVPGYNKSPRVEAVIYDVHAVFPNGKVSGNDRFVEFEIHKADSLHPLAKEMLKVVEHGARDAMPKLGETMDLSLYEIYSDKRYQLAKR